MYCPIIQKDCYKSCVFYDTEGKSCLLSMLARMSLEKLETEQLDQADSYMADDSAIESGEDEFTGEHEFDLDPAEACCEGCGACGDGDSPCLAYQEYVLGWMKAHPGCTDERWKP